MKKKRGLVSCIQEFKKDTILTPIFVIGEVAFDVLIPHSPQPQLAGNLPKCPASPQLIYVRCHKWRLAWYDGFLD